jgi:hypothetical protein
VEVLGAIAFFLSGRKSWRDTGALLGQKLPIQLGHKFTSRVEKGCQKNRILQLDKGIDLTFV